MADKKSHNEKFEELCASYVLNALDENDRREFEYMLAQATDEELDLYQRLSSTANQLAFTIEPNEPPESLKKRVMAQIQTGGTDKSTATGSPSKLKEESGFEWQSFAVAASFALLIVTLSLIFYSFNLRSQISKKESLLDSKETVIVQLKNELQKKNEMLSILGAQDIDMILMAGMDANPNGYGKVIWDPENQQALLQVSNLPPVPKDKTYQLWLIKDNKPVSAGVFATENNGDNFFKIEKMAKTDKQSANAFAVTLEPKGGVPQPTGDMYLMGNMKANK
ncbi:MAG: anti-sigma factor [Balneolaceae bacterium]|jgi:anti-sigma-K factor RskA